MPPLSLASYYQLPPALRPNIGSGINPVSAAPTLVPDVAASADTPATEAENNSKTAPSSKPDDAAAKHDEHWRRSLSLDTRYWPGTYSNRAAGNGGYEFFDLLALPVDLLTDHTGAGGTLLGRTAYFLGGTVWMTYMASPWITAYHEFGHGSRYAALDSDHIQFGTFKFAADGVETHPVSGVIDLYAYLLTHPDQSGAYTEGPFYMQNGHASRNDVIVGTGGVNNSMNMAEIVEDRSYNHGADVQMYMPYIMAKLDAAEYAQNEAMGFQGDLTWVEDYYHQQGYNISNLGIGMAGLGSLLLSSSFYNLAASSGLYIVKGDTTMHAWEVKGVRLPDVDFYLTSQGLSYKLKSGYRVNEHLAFPVAYEQVFAGDTSAFEVHPQVQGELVNGHVGAELTAGPLIGSGGFGFDVDATLHAGRFLVGVGLIQFDRDTLYGERNTPDLTSGDDLAYESWVKLGLQY